MCVCVCVFVCVCICECVCVCIYIYVCVCVCVSVSFFTCTCVCTYFSCLMLSEYLEETRCVWNPGSRYPDHLHCLHYHRRRKLNNERRENHIIIIILLLRCDKLQCVMLYSPEYLQTQTFIYSYNHFLAYPYLCYTDMNRYKQTHSHKRK